MQYRGDGSGAYHTSRLRSKKERSVASDQVRFSVGSSMLLMMQCRMYLSNASTYFVTGQGAFSSGCGRSGQRPSGGKVSQPLRAEAVSVPTSKNSSSNNNINGQTVAIGENRRGISIGSSSAIRNCSSLVVAAVVSNDSRSCNSNNSSRNCSRVSACGNGSRIVVMLVVVVLE